MLSSRYWLPVPTTGTASSRIRSSASTSRVWYTIVGMGRWWRRMGRRRRRRRRMGAGWRWRCRRRWMGSSSWGRRRRRWMGHASSRCSRALEHYTMDGRRVLDNNAYRADVASPTYRPPVKFSASAGKSSVRRRYALDGRKELYVRLIGSLS